MSEPTLPSALDLARELAALPEDTEPNNWPQRNTILYQQQDYRLWMRACLLAAGLTVNPVLLAWFFLEFVNGLRRLPGLWDIELAVTMLDSVKLRLDGLASHPRCGRLTVMWAYHGGFVYAPAGEFARAAECHRFSAKFAESERELAPSLYNAAKAFLQEALAKGDSVRIEAAYAEFQAAWSALKGQLTSGSNEDVCWRLNMAVHQLEFAWLCEKECPDAADELARLEAAPESLKPSFAHALPLMRALQAQRSGNLSEAIALTMQVGEQTAPGWHSLTLLLRAELLAQQGDATGAGLAYRAIQELGTRAHGTHLAVALMRQRTAT